MVKDAKNDLNPVVPLVVAAVPGGLAPTKQSKKKIFMAVFAGFAALAVFGGLSFSFSIGSKIEYSDLKTVELNGVSIQVPEEFEKVAEVDESVLYVDRTTEDNVAAMALLTIANLESKLTDEEKTNLFKTFAGEESQANFAREVIEGELNLDDAKITKATNENGVLTYEFTSTGKANGSDKVSIVLGRATIKIDDSNAEATHLVAVVFAAIDDVYGDNLEIVTTVVDSYKPQ